MASASKKYKSHYFTILNRDRRESGKTSGDFAKEQALARHRQMVQSQIDDLYSNDSKQNVFNEGENKAEAFDRRGEVFGS